MEFDELLKQISSSAGVPEEEVLKKIEAKQKELSGLVSDVGAAHIIANELNVDLPDKAVEQNRLKLHDIMEGMQSVNLFGRVKAVYEPRSFERNGDKSQVASFEVFDDTANLRIVLWGDMADIVKRLKENDIVKVTNGYTREGLNGLEVHLGGRSKIEINPQGSPDDLPVVKEELKKISELSPGEQSVDLVARVVGTYDIRTFTRPDNSSGKVATVMLADSTGTIRCSLWDSKTDIIKEISPGDIVKIENAYTREGLESTELHLGWRSRLIKNPTTDIKLPPLSKFRKVSDRVDISDLKDGDSYKEIRACIVDIPERDLIYELCPNCSKRVREGICDVCGKVKPEKVLIVNAQLDDGTGVIRGVFYRQQAEKFIGLSTNEIEKDSLQKIRERLLGKEMLLSGQVKYNQFSDALEFVVREIRNVNPVEEARTILENIQ